ncbi:MAG: nitrilase-related carbon-nitrogen hydrolase [Ignavibacteria bacterium]
MKVGYLQFKPEFAKPKKNIEKVGDLISSEDFDLLVLPELANSGYLFGEKGELKHVSENPDTGKFCSMLKRISKEKDAYIVSGFCESIKEDNKEIYFNSSILVYPNGEFRVYRKTHLFYDEKSFFEPGNTGFWVYEIFNENFGFVKIGMMICFDWIYPEAARSLALRGADIICHPSNLVMQYCQTAMFTRALENHVYTITANRVGEDINGEKSLNFTGESVILNPKGEYLARGSKEKEEITFIKINPELARDKHINEKNDIFAERRDHFYKVRDKRN